MIEYISLNRMCQDIRENLWKIPRDIIGVVGVPRSGMLAATIISEYLNVGLANFNELISNRDPRMTFQKNHGNRYMNQIPGNRVLVVDDTCFAGSQNLKCRQEIERSFGIHPDYEFVYLVVYMEGDGHVSNPDIFLRDVRGLAKSSDLGIMLYEWNIFNHNPSVMEKMMFDYDGVFCLDPPDERNIDAYERYIENPTPLFLPTKNMDVRINIVTYRLEKYRRQTENFLFRNGIQNVNLTMYKASTYEERGKIKPEIYKGNTYRESDAILFIESDDRQAQMIRSISGKSVYCVSTNKIYS